MLEALHADPVLARVPVVVFSSFASPGEQARVRELGAARFLRKPPDLDGFLRVGTVLRSVLREQASER